MRQELMYFIILPLVLTFEYNFIISVIILFYTITYECNKIKIPIILDHYIRTIIIVSTFLLLMRYRAEKFYFQIIGKVRENSPTTGASQNSWNSVLLKSFGTVVEVVSNRPSPLPWSVHVASRVEEPMSLC